ncbi:MAG: peroxidase, partial [Pseudomonadota bacterium]
MTRMPSLPEDAHLGHVFQNFPRGAKSIGQFSDDLLRGESELSIGEREMLAAFVSGLNACNFCHENHKVIAEMHGVDPTILGSLL